MDGAHSPFHPVFSYLTVARRSRGADWNNSSLGVQCRTSRALTRRETLMPSRFNRRKFLQATAVSAATLSSLPLLGQEKKVPPSERLNVAVVGVAGQGNYNLNELAKAATNIVALCDVDESRTDKARKD